MAFGKKKEKEENGEKSNKSNKGVLIILFILGLVVLGGATFGGVYLFMKTKNTVESQPVVIEETYMELKEFTVNLADEGGKRYFKGEISIGYDKTKEKLKEELTGKEVVVRDNIIFFFKSQKDILIIIAFILLFKFPGHLPPQARLPRVRANPRPRLMISRELVQETAVINDLAFYVGLGIGEDWVRV